MFPFTPHTTLRPDCVRAVPYKGLKLAVLCENYANESGMYILEGILPTFLLW